MESVAIPMSKIVDGLRQDRHACNKELFAFVDRSLGLYGYHAKIQTISPDVVEFSVEDHFDAA
jgi:hypothetical protein